MVAVFDTADDVSDKILLVRKDHPCPFSAYGPHSWVGVQLSMFQRKLQVAGYCQASTMISPSAGSKTTECSPQYTPGKRRTRTIEVTAVGLPRNGTRSMVLALEKLRYRYCAHGFDLFDTPGYAASRAKAVNAKYLYIPRMVPDDCDELPVHFPAMTGAECYIFGCQGRPCLGRLGYTVHVIHRDSSDPRLSPLRLSRVLWSHSRM